MMPEVKEVENFDFPRFNSKEDQTYLIDISLWAEPSKIFDDMYEPSFENEFFDGYHLWFLLFINFPMIFLHSLSSNYKLPLL